MLLTAPLLFFLHGVTTISLLVDSSLLDDGFNHNGFILAAFTLLLIPSRVTGLISACGVAITAYIFLSSTFMWMALHCRLCFLTSFLWPCRWQGKFSHCSIAASIKFSFALPIQDTELVPIILSAVISNSIVGPFQRGLLTWRKLQNSETPCNSVFVVLYYLSFYLGTDCLNQRPLRPAATNFSDVAAVLITSESARSPSLQQLVRQVRRLLLESKPRLFALFMWLSFAWAARYVVFCKYRQSIVVLTASPI